MGNICNYCGGMFELVHGRMKCPYCGSYENVDITSEQEILLKTASQQLRTGHFDDAYESFLDITKKFPELADGFWGAVLSQYGIKYEQDFDGNCIPTCYAISYESLYDSPNFKKALKLADANNKAYYEEQAKIIEDLRNTWIKKASKEQPYDIFISYKDRKPQAQDSESQKLCEESDRTVDSYDAYDLYNELTRKGYRVFFSRVSLKEKIGEAYEPYIFNALNTAKVMILYSSDPDYIESTWVKNEWTRFLKKIKNKEKESNALCVVYKGFKPSALPKALSKCQGIDRESLTFIQDLDNYLKSILYKNVVVEKKKIVNVETQTKSASEPQQLSMIERYLASSYFDKAELYINQLLKENDTLRQAYIYKFMCKNKVNAWNDLLKKEDICEIELFDDIYARSNEQEKNQLLKDIFKMTLNNVDKYDFLKFYFGYEQEEKNAELLLQKIIYGGYFDNVELVSNVILQLNPDNYKAYVAKTLGKLRINNYLDLCKHSSEYSKDSNSMNAANAYQNSHPEKEKNLMAELDIFLSEFDINKVSSKNRENYIIDILNIDKYNQKFKFAKKKSSKDKASSVVLLCLHFILTLASSALQLLNFDNIILRYVSLIGLPLGLICYIVFMVRSKIDEDTNDILVIIQTILFDISLGLILVGGYLYGYMICISAVFVIPYLIIFAVKGYDFFARLFKTLTGPALATIYILIDSAYTLTNPWVFILLVAIFTVGIQLIFILFMYLSIEYGVADEVDCSPYTYINFIFPILMGVLSIVFIIVALVSWRLDDLSFWQWVVFIASLIVSGILDIITISILVDDGYMM